MKEKNKNTSEQSLLKNGQEDSQNLHNSSLNEEIINFIKWEINRNAIELYFGKDVLNESGRISIKSSIKVLNEAADGSIVRFFELCDKITNNYLIYSNINLDLNNDDNSRKTPNKEQNKILKWQKEIQEISSRYLKVEIKNYIGKSENRDAMELYYGKEVLNFKGHISIVKLFNVLNEAADGSIIEFLEIRDKITNNYLTHINIDKELINKISEYLSIKINRKAIINYFGKDVLDNREYFNLEMATKILNHEANGSIEKLQSLIDKVNHEYSKVSTYQKQIKHPLWKKKRLEIFNRDNWKCAKCSCEGKPLHLHHKKYITGLKAWEYENKNLITLCEDCHSKEHDESTID